MTTHTDMSALTRGATLAPPVPAAKPNPSKVRQAVVMLLAVYPLITVILYLVLPLTDGWTIWQRTLLIAPIMVVSIVFFVAPWIQKHFGWFIARLPRPSSR